MRRQGVEDGDEIAAFRRRKAGRRLVEQDEARRAGERQSDLELALLAVAEDRDRRLENIVEMDRVGDRGAPAPWCGRRARAKSDSLPRETPRQATKMLSITVRPPKSWLI